MDDTSVMNAIDFSSSASIDSCQNNGFYGGISLASGQKCDDASNNTIDLNANSTPFVNAKNLNFTTASGNGASMSVFKELRHSVEDLGYKIEPADYKLNIDGILHSVKSEEYYNREREDVRKWAKKVPGFSSIVGPESFTTAKGKSIYGFKVIFEDKKNVTGSKEFYLEVPYE